MKHQPQQQQLPPEYFWKKYTDPLTEEPFEAVTVKSKFYSLRSRDPDFRPHYKGTSPLHYGVVVAPSGFAAEDAVYSKPRGFLFRDREGLEQMLASRLLRTSYNALRDLNLACNSYELALDCCGYLKIPAYEQAGLALRASWVYMDLAAAGEDSVDLRISELRQQALEKYLDAYENEDTSKTRLGGGGVGYMIAELLREKGEVEESLRWFSRLIHDKSITGSLLKTMRNQMEICREQRRGTLSKFAPPVALDQRTSERTIFTIYRDQLAWLEQQAKTTRLSDNDIIRAALDALIDSGVDLREFSSADELRQAMTAILSGAEDE